MPDIHFPDLHVLIVDDDPMMIELLSMLLHDCGVGRIETANDGQAALGLLSADAADLLICDLNMPGMDGVQLLSQISGLERHPAIILLSGEDQRILDSSRQFAEAKRLTVLGVLRKPVALEPMLALLVRFRPDNPRTANAEDVERVAAPSDAHLRAGLDCEAVRLVYQPKIDLRTGNLTGVEGLLRWLDPESGIAFPASEVVSAAERHGMIDELTFAVFALAAKDRRHAATLGLSINFAINLSLENLKDAGIVDRMLAIVTRESGDPSDFTLEVTETHLVDDLARVLEPLLRLRLQGFKIALDDFGTGASTMQMLSQLPSTELKIDRSFVAAAPLSVRGRTFLQSAVELGRQMGQSIVAEGVETGEELALALELGCHVGQGHLFARPLPLDELIAWARGRASGVASL